MQEIVILLTGVAGAASAVAYRRLPGRGGRRRGAGPRGEGPGNAGREGAAAGRVRSRIGVLAAERDILGKAISRVHGDEGLDARQKDALLAMYQRQLSAVLAKIDRLEEASRHPDLGPVGDGLAALMDQKLSSLDERLHELSARIAAAVPAAAASEEGAARRARAARPGRKERAQEGAAVGGGGGSGDKAQQATLDAQQPQAEAPAAHRNATQLSKLIN